MKTNTFSVIQNGELIAKTNTLKEAWQVAYDLHITNRDWEEVEYDYEYRKHIFHGTEDEWDYKYWLSDNYNGDRIVEDTKRAKQRHDDYLREHQAVKFSALWVIIHIILCVFTSGITLILWTLPWVIAKYQTKDNFSGLGVFLFGFVYNIYRLVK